MLKINLYIYVYLSLILFGCADNEWGRVVEDSKKFWDDTSKISPRDKKVVDAFKAYASTMDKAGYPYR